MSRFKGDDEEATWSPDNLDSFLVRTARWRAGKEGLRHRRQMG